MKVDDERDMRIRDPRILLGAIILGLGIAMMLYGPDWLNLLGIGAMLLGLCLAVDYE